MRGVTSLLALGDSISCGEGVGIQLHRTQTWVAQLARALDADVELLARSGARVRDVRAEQLPLALARPAPLVTMLIGLNDVIRTGFDADLVRHDLHAVATALRAPGRTLMLLRLHDPTLQLPLPTRLRRHFVERVRVINAAIDALSGDGVVVVDLARIGALRQRGAWAIDRLHPGPVGHRAIAAAATLALRDAGYPVPSPIPMPVVPKGPTRRAEGRWLLRHFVPYLARHLRHVGPPLARALVGRVPG